jgi:putative cell wall-binding protein
VPRRLTLLLVLLLGLALLGAPAAAQEAPAPETGIDAPTGDGPDVAETALPLQERPEGIERVAGRDRVTTAVEASRRGFTTAETVVIASAASFPDALAAAPLAASVGGPLLLAGPRVHPLVLEELRRLGAREVVVVGAVAAVPLVVQRELGRAGLQVRRIAGDSRFDTAALIAREVGSTGRAIVVSGVAYADALSVAPMAAAQRTPILLTPPGSMNGDTARALVDLEVTETLVVGGPAAVSDAVLQALPGATRIAGRNRYETSLAVAEHWLAQGMRLETVSIATGRSFPDALAAGPVAGLVEGPLLLVDGRDPAVPAETYAWLAERHESISGAWAFGGTGALSDAVLDRLRRAIEGQQ